MCITRSCGVYTMTICFEFILIYPPSFNYIMDASIIIYTFFFLKLFHKFCVVDIFGSIGQFTHYLDISKSKRANNSSLMVLDDPGW